MKTYPYRFVAQEKERLFAFEVDIVCIPPAMAARLLADVDGVTDVEPRQMFSKSSDVHVEFQYRGQLYFVREPHGNGSRYWIGPKDDVNDGEDIAALEAEFKRYRPPFHRVLLGDVLTLRFVARSLRRND